MKKYTTIMPVTLTSGVIKLNDDQARRRRHMIEEVEGQPGVYKIIAPCRFKVGETFGYDGAEMTPGLAKFFKGQEKALQKKRAEKRTKTTEKSKLAGFFADIFKKETEQELTDEEKAHINIINVIGNIDPDNLELWTKTHGPKLSVLRDAVGDIELTEEARDSAWELYQLKQEQESSQEQ